MGEPAIRPHHVMGRQGVGPANTFGWFVCLSMSMVTLTWSGKD